jgi:hypothetical protein
MGEAGGRRAAPRGFRSLAVDHLARGVKTPYTGPTRN